MRQSLQGSGCLRTRIRICCWLGAIWLGAGGHLHAGSSTPASLGERIGDVVQVLHDDRLVGDDGRQQLSRLNLRVRRCGGYPLYRQLSQADFPALLLGTHRLGGILSRQHDDETYRTFFHLVEEQIVEHRNGRPLRPASLHRCQDLPGLLFHEMIHWLGHEHPAVYPDLTHLYGTCCFGGSDFISDPERNQAHQRTACAIPEDDELWSQGRKPYRQMRIWHDKGYDALKAQMRADYDP